MVNPLVTANPLDQIDPIEIEIPELYPGCAVTRAMAKKALSNEVEISLSDIFMVHLPESLLLLFMIKLIFIPVILLYQPLQKCLLIKVENIHSCLSHNFLRNRKMILNFIPYFKGQQLILK